MILPVVDTRPPCTVNTRPSMKAWPSQKRDRCAGERTKQQRSSWQLWNIHGAAVTLECQSSALFDFFGSGTSAPRDWRGRSAHRFSEVFPYGRKIKQSDMEIIFLLRGKKKTLKTWALLPARLHYFCINRNIPTLQVSLLTPTSQLQQDSLRIPLWHWMHSAGGHVRLNGANLFIN